ncbi:MAG: hypothetical protein ACRDV4_06820, partial [Acidimicrobiales bacterium]
MAVDSAVHALRGAEVDAVPGPDMVSFSLDGMGHSLRIEPVAYCTGQRARELVATAETPRFVVSEKITADGRTVLSDAG